VYRLTVLIFATVFLMGSCDLLAQGRGRHGGGVAVGPSGNPTAPTNTNEMNDFERAVAMQASPDQVSQFQVLSKNTEAAKKQAHDFRQMIETGAKAPDFSDPIDDLKDAVEQARDGSKEFMEKLSGPQKSGFKGLIKKLAKATSEVAKQGKALDLELGNTKPDNKRIASLVEELEKALTNLQAEQLDLGKAMGIQMAST